MTFGEGGSRLSDQDEIFVTGFIAIVAAAFLMEKAGSRGRGRTPGIGRHP